MTDPHPRPSPPGGEGETVVEVVAAVIERGGRFLIARRPAALDLGGRWEFPGGKTEPGESATDALEREIREELGVVAAVGPLIETVDWAYPEKRIRLRFFHCTVEGEPRPLEGQEIAWVCPADLGRYEFPPADAILLDRLGRGGPQDRPLDGGGDGAQDAALPSFPPLARGGCNT